VSNRKTQAELARELIKLELFFRRASQHSGLACSFRRPALEGGTFVTFVTLAVDRPGIHWRSRDQTWFWTYLMGRRFILFLLALLATGSACAQNSDTSQQTRNVERKVTPVYPDLAKRTHISGVVKLRATIAPNGLVTLIEPVGGNPVLIKAAQDALTKWKYAPAREETRELIELRFDPR
jgi:TonB family protein